MNNQYLTDKNIKCNIHFMTQYAYIENDLIHINEYQKEYKKKLKCQNNHELIFCKGNLIRPYFRHKNSFDVDNNPAMSEWHCKWQGFFPLSTIEIEFKKKDGQLKTRRADVVLNEEYILEIQHSDILDSEVVCRTQDYKLHNKKLIWIVDGNTDDVIMNKLSDDTFIIEFNKKFKYNSFIHNYEYILIDINDKIFKIPVKLVSNKMFHAKHFKNIDEVIETLKKNPDKIWNLWEDTNEIKPSLTIKQEGAGNGKTFGIWKNISLNFDKQMYIITTKQHSAKTVILNELNEQAKRKEFHIIDNMEEIEDSEYGKQYRVNYKHKYSNKKCTVLIGTIDSFIFALSSKSIGGNSYFEGLLNNICKNGCDKMNSNNGNIKYAGLQIKLNKMTELWLDESQDLPIIYYKAIIIIMLNTKLNCVVVGDKLQSLEYENNIMTLDEKDNNINVIRDIPKNINRRIKVKKMTEKINNLVNFKKYNVPEIMMNNEEQLKDYGINTIETFEQKCIYANDTDQQKIDSEVNNIIEMVDKQVNEFNYAPEDFLFIFPIMKKNTLAGELETKLNEYWLTRIKKDEYKQYAVLHKHEEGTVINTKKSIYATRLMSIKASKGDGRSVVFVLNCTEQTLKMVSNNEKNVVYESHLHVALTRAKHKIYFGLQHNNDDIHKRFCAIDKNIKYIPEIKCRLSLDKLISYIDKEKCMEILKKNKITEIEFEKKNTQENTQENTQIDWIYHCIRRSIYYNYALFEIFEHNKNNNLFYKTQIKTVLDILSNISVKKVIPKEFYKLIKANKDEDTDFFPICNLSRDGIYSKYCEIIENIILNIQNKYRESNLSIGKFNALESSILIYMIDLFKNKQYHEITPCTIYNIIDAFIQKNEIQKLFEESKYIKKIVKDVMVGNVLNTESINWNIHHIIKLYGNTKDLELYHRYYIIGYSDTTVHHFIFQTEFNNLNYWDTIIKIIFERYIINNPNSNNNEKNNKTRYDGKKIITYLFVLKHNTYKIFDWNFEKNINEELDAIYKNGFFKYFENFNKKIFNYCKFIKENKSEWKNYSSPYEFLENCNAFQNIPYAQKFFYILSKKNKCDAKKITDNENLFNEQINEFINEMCNAFFPKNNNGNEDDEEW